MSQVSATIVVETNPIEVQVEQTQVGVTVESVNLGILSGGFAAPGGNLGELQYNAGVLQGIPNVTWDGTNLNFGDISNIKIDGGQANFVIKTDGAGNISFGDAANANFANFAGNITVSSQPNITSIGTLTQLNVNGTSNLSDVGNVKILGGTNGFVLQTDGTGNLNWTAQTGNGTGNGVPGGANSQIQFNDEGSFGGAAGFTFNKTSNIMNVPGSVTSIFNGPIVNLPYGIENVNLIPGQGGNVAGTFTIDVISNSIAYNTTTPTANLTLNIRGNSNVSLDTLLDTGKSISATYVMRNGNIAYKILDVEIDGDPANIFWVGGREPSTLPNALNSYTFTVIKLSSDPTYEILGSLTRYAE